MLEQVGLPGASGNLFALDPRRVYPVLARGEGVHVWDTDGRRYLDAIAGIATVTLGYGRSEVVAALEEQASRLPFAAGNIFANEPVLKLASSVAEITPGDLDWIHFTSGGSEAVEVAVKMARQYHVERGDPDRHVVIGREVSYHGATIAGLSYGGAQPRRRKYAPLLLAAPHIPAAYCYRCPWNLAYPGCGLPCASDLERAILEEGPENVAAFIVEPIVASVGGTIAPQPEYFPEIREICDRYGILLIVDEVVTGFGRTGRPFAMEHWNVVPDLMVLGKGLSGGYAPLGAVAASEGVHQVFIDAAAPFEHVFTYGGNPIAAAVGVVVIDIWRRERLTEHVADLADTFSAALQPLRAFDFVGDVRSVGFMAGIEFVADRETREPFPTDMRIAPLVRDACLDAGVVTYPGSGMADGTRGDIISLYPPLTFTEDNISEMRDRLVAGFTAVGAAIGRTAGAPGGGLS